MRVDRERNLKLVLSKLPATHTELYVALVIECGPTTIHRVLKYAVANGLAYLSSYKPAPIKGPACAVYTAGKPPKKFKTPEKPAPYSNVEAVRRYRARKRKDGSWQDNLAQQRSRHWQTKPPKPDALTAAFFGGVRPLSSFPSTSISTTPDKE